MLCIHIHLNIISTDADPMSNIPEVQEVSVDTVHKQETPTIQSPPRWVLLEYYNIYFYPSIQIQRNKHLPKNKTHISLGIVG